jgi:hypothetical protein
MTATMLVLYYLLPLFAGITFGIGRDTLQPQFVRTHMFLAAPVLLVFSLGSAILGPQFGLDGHFFEEPFNIFLCDLVIFAVGWFLGSEVTVSMRSPRQNL